MQGPAVTKTAMTLWGLVNGSALGVRRAGIDPE
jgi:hypothetical protein